MGPEGSRRRPRGARGTRRAPAPAADTTQLRSLALGVVPLALFGLVVALVMFYPSGGGDAGDEGTGPGAAGPPDAGVTPEPLPTADLFVPGTTTPPTLPPDTVGGDGPPGPAGPGGPGGAGAAGTSVSGRPRTAAVQQVSRPVSALPFRRVSNFWGPVERDSSNGEDRAGDGETLEIEGRRFGSGLGVHAPSEVELDLAGHCSAFTAQVGLDDEEGEDSRENVGAVAFAVIGDGRLLYRSPTVRPDDDPLPVSVGVAGVRILTLRVDDLGSTKNDHADWAAATLRCTP